MIFFSFVLILKLVSNQDTLPAEWTPLALTAPSQAFHHSCHLPRENSHPPDWHLMEPFISADFGSGPCYSSLLPPLLLKGATFFISWVSLLTRLKWRSVSRFPLVLGIFLKLVFLLLNHDMGFSWEWGRYENKHRDCCQFGKSERPNNSSSPPW